VGEYGFGYTSSDLDITTGSRGNMYDSGNKYCRFSSAPSDVVAGDVVADYPGPIDDKVFTITYKVAVSTTQPASTYRTYVTYIVTGNF
jgi:hypothetical protein